MSQHDSRISGKASLRSVISALLALHGAALMATEAGAQTSDGGDSTAPPSEVDTVVVIGSRSGEATVLNSAAPVQVVSGADLAETGARTLSEAL